MGHYAVSWASWDCVILYTPYTNMNYTFGWDLVVVACIVFNDTITEGKKARKERSKTEQSRKRIRFYEEEG